MFENAKVGDLVRIHISAPLNKANDGRKYKITRLTPKYVVIEKRYKWHKPPGYRIVEYRYRKDNGKLRGADIWWPESISPIVQEEDNNAQDNES